MKEKEHFNPLPRKEGDMNIRLNDGTADISIHSLVKRETFTPAYRTHIPPDFNPLPRKEGDDVLGLL